MQAAVSHADFVVDHPTPKTPCPRMVLYAVPGWGKTTAGANTPKPLILQARDERGVERLIDGRRINAVATSRMNTWPQYMSALDAIATDRRGYQTLVIDALGGFERLNHEHICATQFKGNWGESGFARYQAGYERAVTEWTLMLQKLDKINQAGVIILLIGHARIKKFDNPLGASFDRYECDVHHKAWSTIDRWADMVLFGNYYTVVEVASENVNIAKQTGKAIGRTDRVVYSERRDAFDAKNGYGMDPEFMLSGDRTQSWNEIWNQVISNKE